MKINNPDTPTGKISYFIEHDTKVGKINWATQTILIEEEYSEAAHKMLDDSWTWTYCDKYTPPQEKELFYPQCGYCGNKGKTPKPEYYYYECKDKWACRARVLFGHRPS